MNVVRTKLLLCWFLLFLVGGLCPLRAQDTGADKLKRVGQVILAAQGQSPGELYRAIKQACPGVAIETIREFNARQAELGFSAEDISKIRAVQGEAQSQVRAAVLDARPQVLKSYRAGKPDQARSLYGYGDVGSWVNKAQPDASMDIDWTIFGVDPAVTAEVRELYKAELLKILAPQALASICRISTWS